MVVGMAKPFGEEIKPCTCAKVRLSDSICGAYLEVDVFLANGYSVNIRCGKGMTEMATARSLRALKEGLAAGFTNGFAAGRVTG